MIIPESFKESATSIPNPFLQRLRKSTNILYGILLITAPIFGTIYAILWSSIQPPLDLIEIGNAWTFILFLSTCVLVTILAFVLTILQRFKFPLRWKHVFVFDLMLISCWSGLFLVMLGAMEHYQDKSRCNEAGVQCGSRSAPKVPTHFGIYIAGVCGRNLTESELYWASSVRLVDKDEEKCEATKVLQIEIFCMYIWIIELMVISILELVLGVGNCKGRRAPEFLYIRAQS